MRIEPGIHSECQAHSKAAMPLTFLPAAARSPKPWTNGGGVTTDVFVWPQGAGLEDFTARVSIAEVAADGPFSVFASIDRTTTILAGGGFDLAFEGKDTHRLTQAAAPLAYSGDRPAFSRNIAGPTTDLNAMSRRGRMRHVMERRRLDAPLHLTSAGMTLVLLADGAATIEGPAGAIRLGPLDACLIAQDQARLTPEPGGTLYLIRFDPLA